MPTSGGRSVSVLLILGAGGHARVVTDTALSVGWKRVVVGDDDPDKWNTELLPGMFIVSPQALVRWGITHMHVAIGDNRVRERMATRFAALPLVSIVHPNATVSPHAVVGSGAFIAARAVVAAGARLDAGVIVNHGSVIDHDCIVGAYSHIAPNATLAGEVRVGAHCLIGAGANVLAGLEISPDVIVGAGSVVTRGLLATGVYAGVPARKMS